MAILDTSVHVTTQQVDAGEQAQRAVALVFLVARESLVRPGPPRQIGRGVADRLDARLLVIGDDGHRRRRALAPLQNRDLAIDAEHFGHLCLESLIAALQIVAYLVRLDLMRGEDFANRALHDAPQRGMPGRNRMLADVPGQQPRGPQLVRPARPWLPV
jgi:hypothetical protein